MTSIITTTSILLALVTATLVTGNHHKICSTDNCTNDQVRVKEDAEGPVFRYSKNAANFREPKVSGRTTKEESANQSESRSVRVSEALEHRARANGNHDADKSVSPLRGVGNSQINNSVHIEQLDGSVFRANANRLSDTTENQQLHNQSSGNDHQRVDDYTQQKQQHQEIRQQKLGDSSSGQQSRDHPVGQNPNTNGTSGSSKGSWHDVSKDPVIAKAVEDGIFWSSTVERAIPPGKWCSRMSLWHLTDIFCRRFLSGLFLKQLLQSGLWLVPTLFRWALHRLRTGSIHKS